VHADGAVILVFTLRGYAKYFSGDPVTGRNSYAITQTKKHHENKIKIKKE
jgi:hypothetical protein